MKRLLGVMLFLSLSTSASAMSPAGKALLDRLRAKYQPAAGNSAPSGNAPAVVPMHETEKNNPLSTDPEFNGQQEGTYQPGPDVPPGDFSSLNAVDPTYAHEENGKIVPGVPKKPKISKSSKKGKSKGKSKAGKKTTKSSKTKKSKKTKK